VVVAGSSPVSRSKNFDKIYRIDRIS